MSRGRQYAANCGLCFAELATTAIAGVQLGDRCVARAMAIAAESQVAVEEPVRRAAVGGVVCTDCGAELEVDEEQLSIRCPNGHPVRIRERPAAPRTRYRAKPSARVCPRCNTIVEREPGQVGSTPKMHPRCRTSAEAARLEEKRQYSAAWYAANKERWKDYEQRKRAKASPLAEAAD